jgi:Rad3-related DNA helicase
MAAMTDDSPGRHDALLIMPPGTGKTVCYVSCILAFLSVCLAEGKDYQVIIASPSHKQLDQVAREIELSIKERIDQSTMRNNRNFYYPLRGITFAGRDMFCINQKVREECEKRSVSLHVGCAENIGACRYNKRAKSAKKTEQGYFGIAEMLTASRFKEMCSSKSICPLMMSRELSPNSDILLVPKSVLFDRRSKYQFLESKRPKILILDEGHNVPGFSSASYSFVWSVICIVDNMQDFLLDLDSKLPKFFLSEKLYILACELQSLFNRIARNERLGRSDQNSEIQQGIQNSNNTDSHGALGAHSSSSTEPDEVGTQSIPKKELRLQITFDQVDSILTKLNLNVDQLNQILDWLSSAINTKSYSERVNFVKDFILFWKVVASANFRPDFGLYLTDRDGLQIHFICVSGRPPLVDLVHKNIKTLVVTSGTYSYDAAYKELGCEFKHKFCHEPIIPKNQLESFIISSYFNSEWERCELTSALSSRSVEAFAQNIVQISLACGSVSLCVIPSYQFANELYSILKNNNSIQTIVETSNADCVSHIEKVMEQPQNKPLTILAAARGKICEGSNLPKGVLKAVIVVGIPFANIDDLRVRLRCERDPEYYDRSAMQAVIQGVGRLIRGDTDYGIAVLLDSRYKKYKCSLEKDLNLQELAPFHVEFALGEVEKRIRDFLRKRENN